MTSTTEAILLSPTELTELAELRQLEATVDKHLGSFLEAGQALAEIYQRGFFRHSHKTFVDYLNVRWPEIGQAYAWRLISSASVVKDLATSPTGDVLPTRERQIRPLGGLPTPQRQEVWHAAVSEAGGKVPSSTRVAELAAKARDSLGADRKLALLRQEEDRLKRSAQDRQALTSEQVRKKHLARSVFLLRQAIRHLVAADGERLYGETLGHLREVQGWPPYSVD